MKVSTPVWGSVISKARIKNAAICSRVTESIGQYDVTEHPDVIPFVYKVSISASKNESSSSLNGSLESSSSKSSARTKNAAISPRVTAPPGQNSSRVHPEVTPSSLKPRISPLNG